jgi:hypothetical protein
LASKRSDVRATAEYPDLVNDQQPIGEDAALERLRELVLAQGGSHGPDAHLAGPPDRETFLQRTAGLLTGCIIDCRLHSTHVFLNHAQMDPESVQVDFEWACNLEQPNGGFNFGESYLIFVQSGRVCALIEFAFEVSQSPVESLDTTDV